MKILITGATGFIGKHLIHSLLQKQYDLHVLIREESNNSSLNKHIKIFRHTDDDPQKLLDYCAQERFDGIIHLASLFLASHQPNDIKNLIQSNIQLGTELLEACKYAQISWFLNTGTFWQHYESDSYNPVNLYAASKEAFETIAQYYTQTSNLIFTTIKLNDTFGPNDTRNKIFNLWQKIALSQEPLEMSGGEQVIDISYIEDVIHAYELMIEHLSSSQSSKFNNRSFAVSSPERMSLRKLSKLYEKATGCTLPIYWGKRPYREREVMLPWARGECVPGWQPKYTLTQAIQKTVMEQYND